MVKTLVFHLMIFGVKGLLTCVLEQSSFSLKGSPSLKHKVFDFALEPEGLFHPGGNDAFQDRP